MLQDSREPLTDTLTEFLPLSQTAFLPEADIPNDKALREDYERLRITYEIQRYIGSEISVDRVLDRILDRTFEFLHYDRAAILLVDKEGKLKLRSKRNTNKKGKLILSSTLIKYVIKKKEGIISSDVLSDDRFNAADSIIISGMRSSITAPILHQQEVLGVIVIQTFERVGAFKKKDLQLLVSIANHTAQFIKTSLLHEELRMSFESAIRTLSATVDAKHPLTAGHSERVAELSSLIAREMGLNGRRAEALRFAALLHDIGKIGIPDNVLLKDGPFDPEERDEMNSHPLKTKKILEKFHFPKRLKGVPEIAALHHERIDGKGYPKGIGGDDLPMEARIIAVADVFDALTSPRDYPKYDNNGRISSARRMSIEKAVSMLEDDTGTHFDERVVKAFKRCLPKALQLYRGNHYTPEYVDEYLNSRPPMLRLHAVRSQSSNEN